MSEITMSQIFLASSLVARLDLSVIHVRFIKDFLKASGLTITQLIKELEKEEVNEWEIYSKERKKLR